MLRFISFLLISFLSYTAYSQSVYVSPNGSSSGTGTITSPYRQVSDFDITDYREVYLEYGGTYNSFHIDDFKGVISAYGNSSLNRPSIDGRVRVPNFDTFANNIYKILVADSIVQLLNVENYLPKARYPNINEYVAGDVNSVNGRVYFNVSTFPNTSFIENASAVINGSEYTWEGREVHNVNNTWFDLSEELSQISHRDSVPFYLENKYEYLDALGEWYYDSNEGALYIYGINPNTTPLYYIHQEHGIQADWHASNVQIEDVEIVGFYGHGIWLKGFGSNNSVKRSVIRFVSKGVEMFGSNHEISSNLFKDLRIAGVWGWNIDSTVIEYNIFENIGTYPTFGKGVGNFTAIYLDKGTDNIVRYNDISFTGYCGITFYTDRAEIAYNEVRNCMLITGDGGALYTWGYNSFENNIHHNIIQYGKGYNYKELISPWANGIYIDNNSTKNQIRYNTVIDVSGSGIVINASSSANIIMDNVVVNAKQYALQIWDWGGYTYDNIVINNQLARDIKTDKALVGLYSISDNQHRLATCIDNDYIDLHTDSILYYSNSSWDHVFPAITLEDWLIEEPAENVGSVYSNKVFTHTINYNLDPLIIKYTDFKGMPILDTLQFSESVLYPMEQDSVVDSIDCDTIIFTGTAFDYIADGSDAYANIYPNPTTGKIFLRFYNIDPTIIGRYDVLEESQTSVLYSRNVSISKPRSSWNLGTNSINIQAGNYWLYVYDDFNMLHMKIPFKVY